MHTHQGWRSAATMPTYADLYNEKLLAEGRSLPSNPVRLTISKGEYVWDAQLSRFRYDEQWLEEHLMEYESQDETDHPPPSAILNEISQPQSHANPVIDAKLLAEEAGSLKALQNGDTPLSLWILDTNTLMSSLELLKALFASLLTRNVAAASVEPHYGRQPLSCPLRLVIPYVVITELDGLKNSRRREDSGRMVAIMARDANTWLLSALQKQKRVPIDQSGATLPDSLRPMFVQPSSHYRASRKSGNKTVDADFLSNDEEIIRFCLVLQQQTAPSAGIWFCSDDINARTRAELDDIETIGILELTRCARSQYNHIQSIEKRMVHIADALIEQWEYQLGNELSYQPPLPQQMSNTLSDDAHIEEIDMLDDENHFPRPINASDVPPAVVRHRQIQPTSSVGRNTGDSIHAPGFTPPIPAPATMQANTILPSDITTSELNPQLDWSELMRQTHRR